ncbi:MAG: LysM peptidoglycan-binding domain-containing protein [Dictyoglomaceae bacterium]
MRRFFREVLIYTISFLLIVFLASQLFSIERMPQISKSEEIKAPEKRVEVIKPPKQNIVKEEKNEKQNKETYTQIIYEVKVGDTTIGIAKKYSIDWKELARINNLKDPNRLFVGQKLIIPIKKD